MLPEKTVLVLWESSGSMLLKHDRLEVVFAPRLESPRASSPSMTLFHDPIITVF